MSASAFVPSKRVCSIKKRASSLSVPWVILLHAVLAVFSVILQTVGNARNAVP